MASHAFPGLGIVGGRAAGENGWAAEMNANLMMLSALTQGSVKSRVTTLPGSPTNGDIYIVPSGGDANKIAVRDSGAWTYYVPTEGWRFWVQDEDIVVAWTGSAWLAVTGNPIEHITIALGDETTALTAGTAKVTLRMPYAFTLTAVRSSVTTAPTGSTLVVDINENGSSILSTKLSIDASEKTSTTAATAAVISDTSLADDAEITIDIDQIGSTIAGAGLKVVLIGRRT